MDFISKWCSFVEEYKEAAVATVVNGFGSMPRENGAQMLISITGATMDTVGGGRLEADVISWAKHVISNKTSLLRHFELTGSDVALSDMICGGEGDVVIYYSSEKDLPVLEHIKSLGSPEGWLILPIDFEAEANFVAADGTHTGSCPGELLLKPSGRKETFIENTGSGSHLIQWLSMPGRLHILGAGHISREIVKIASIADIACSVYDDRAEYVSRERFPDADCVLVGDLSSPPLITADCKDMIVIVTRGHICDKDCLEWALKTKAGYIGMIGSRRKVNMILNSMIEKGYPEEKVRNVCSPIGLNIGARTPAEIAVSIVAQLIEFKRCSGTA